LPTILYDGGMDRPPPSDSKLLALSLFTAFSIVCIGIFGDKNISAYLWQSSPLAISAAAAAATGGDSSLCIDPQHANSSAFDSQCKPGCEYLVSEGGEGGTLTVQVVKSPPAGTTAAAQAKMSPGQVTYMQIYPSGGSQAPVMTCKPGADGQPPTINGAAMTTGYNFKLASYGGIATYVPNASPALAAPTPTQSITPSASGQIPTDAYGTSPSVSTANPLDTQYQYTCDSSGNCQTIQYIGANGASTDNGPVPLPQEKPPVPLTNEAGLTADVHDDLPANAVNAGYPEGTIAAGNPSLASEGQVNEVYGGPGSQTSNLFPGAGIGTPADVPAVAPPSTNDAAAAPVPDAGSVVEPGSQNIEGQAVPLPPSNALPSDVPPDAMGTLPNQFTTPENFIKGENLWIEGGMKGEVPQLVMVQPTFPPNPIIDTSGGLLPYVKTASLSQNDY
jgi:hypothetical protein